MTTCLESPVEPFPPPDGGGGGGHGVTAEVMTKCGPRGGPARRREREGEVERGGESTRDKWGRRAQEKWYKDIEREKERERERRESEKRNRHRDTDTETDR